eukprot:scaffold311_cov173-Amphora_coffeaeformis.AAC.4
MRTCRKENAALRGRAFYIVLVVGSILIFVGLEKAKNKADHIYPLFLLLVLVRLQEPKSVRLVGSVRLAEQFEICLLGIVLHNGRPLPDPVGWYDMQ